MEFGSLNDFKKKILTRTMNTLNNNYSNTIINHSNINTNSNPLKYIYDEEFISSINGLSTSIKNYFQNNKIYLGNIKLISENISDQILFSKNALTDILLYFNQMTQTRYNPENMSYNTNEKYLKEKMKLINERIEKINEFKINMLSNIKKCELTFLTFFEEAKESFKKMKIIRTEKIENYNKKIIVNKNLDYTIYKHQRASSHSPTYKTNITNNKLKLNSTKIDIKNENSINTKTSINAKNQNNILTINNEELNEMKILKQKYLELSQENKKLKEEISIMKSNNNYKNNKENLSNGEIQYKEISITHKKSSSATKKKYVQKPLTIGIIKNKTNKNHKSISRSRIQSQTQTQAQTQITNTSNTLAEEDNNKNKLMKNMNKKTEVIPIRNEKEYNILSISKNSADMSIGSGEFGGSCRINNNFNNNFNLASMVLSFLKDMKTLQEKITQKVQNIKVLKKNFELKKRELKKYSENILDKNFSATYAGTNINNIIPENLKAKSKEQSLKASLESFNLKDNLNYNDIIKDYESKNREQNNIILNKEKDIENLKKEIIEKDKKIEKIEKDLKTKEEKIKTEKEISNLKDDKLNSEKSQNQKMNEEILELKDKNKQIENDLEKAKNDIENLEKINKQLEKIQTQQKNVIEDLNKKSKLDINKFNSCKEELEKYKPYEKENTSLKSEIIRLKQQITQCNSNLVTISNTNESIIHEKDKIIKNFSNNIKELNKQIDLLNNEISKHGNNLSNSTILAEEISNLRKNNDNSNQKIQELQIENKQLKNRMADIKSNYISHDENFVNIKKLLNDLNNKTESNLKKLEENEKKFDLCCNSNSNRQNKDNINNKDEDKFLNLNKYLKDIKDNTEQYELLIGEIKSNNDFLIKINKDIFDKN